MPGAARDTTPLVYLDANPFIYLIEGEVELSAPLVPLFGRLKEAVGTAVTSELTLAEVLSPTTRRGKLPPQTRRAYLNLLVWGSFIGLEPITRPVLYETVEFRAVRKLKLPDAIHLATAFRLGCRFFMTRDSQFPMPQGMVRITPDEDGVSRFFEALA